MAKTVIAITFYIKTYSYDFRRIKAVTNVFFDVTSRETCNLLTSLKSIIIAKYSTLATQRYAEKSLHLCFTCSAAFA